MKGGLHQQSSRTRGLAGALGPHVGKWEGWTISSDNYLGWHTGLSFTLLSPFLHSLNHQPQLPVRTCILIACSVLRVCMYYHFMSAPYEALIHASKIQLNCLFSNSLPRHSPFHPQVDQSFPQLAVPESLSCIPEPSSKPGIRSSWFFFSTSTSLPGEPG